MKVKVNQTNIKKGDPLSGNTCPIALALIRQFPSCKNQISVRTKTVCRLFDYNWNGLKLPGTATRFINRFDRGLPVEPFEFEIKCTPEEFKQYMKEG